MKHKEEDPLIADVLLLLIGAAVFVATLIAL
jgi:hypothetical protein